MPKVSIVLPTYNGEKYLRESIDSIIGQTFSDWELIIVNDCSTDNTQKIIDEYVARDNRIKCIINKTNQKLPESLNIGFRKAKGEFLTWTSDDNMYLPEALGVMLEYMQNYKDCVMVCSAMNMIDADGEYLHKHYEYLYERMLYNDCVGACFLYRKCVIKDVGEYDPSFFLVEDYEYWLRILFHYGKIHYIDIVLYLYRVHDLSLTATRKEKISSQLQFLRQHHIVDIIDGLRDKTEILTQIYCEMKKANAISSDIKERFYNIIPELRYEKEITAADDYVMYGAGNYGKRAYEKYRDHIICFVDTDCNKIGRKLEDKDILSLSSETLKNIEQPYFIMITVAPVNVYSCIVKLKECGIYEYVLYLD